MALVRQDWDTVVTVCTPLRADEFLAGVSWTRSQLWVMQAWIQASVALGRLAAAQSALAS